MVFRMPHEPQGSCGSPEDPLVLGSVKDPGAPARDVWVRLDVSGKSAGGDGTGESPRHDSGMTGFEEGLLEFWGHGRGARACGLERLSRVRRGRPPARESAGTSRRSREDAGTLKSVTAFALERALGVETPGAAADLACPRSRREMNPSRERETPRTDRGGRGKPADSGSLRPMSLEGRETPGGAIRSCRTGEDVATRTL